MDIEKIKEFVKYKHEGQLRKHGTPYYLHPFAVCDMLKQKGYTKDYQVAALCHDLLEDTDTTIEELEKIIDLEIINAVRLLTKEQGYIMEEYVKRISTNELARAVKLADRIHNLQESVLTSVEFRKRYIKETKKYYKDMSRGTDFEKELQGVIEQVEEIIRKEE